VNKYMETIKNMSIKELKELTKLAHYSYGNIVTQATRDKLKPYTIETVWINGETEARTYKTTKQLQGYTVKLQKINFTDLARETPYKITTLIKK